MRLQEIDAFLAVCKHGSFSRAAEKTFTTQSTISQQIAALEREFNTQLIVRGKGQHRIELTPAGRVFLNQAEKWTVLWSETKTAMASQTIETYTFASVVSFSDYVFPGIYHRFQQESLRCSLHLLGSTSMEIFDCVENGTYNSGLVCNIRPSKNISVIPIGSEEFTFICREESDYPETVRVHNLNTLNYIQINWCQEFEAWTNHWFGTHAKPLLQANRIRHAERYLSTADMWTVVPASYALTFGKGFRTCKIDSPPPRRMFYLISKYPYQEPFYSWVYQSLISTFRAMAGVELLGVR